MPTRSKRKKISVSVTPENSTFLNEMIERGIAKNMAEALDYAISIARQADERQPLEAATEDRLNS